MARAVASDCGTRAGGTSRVAGPRGLLRVRPDRGQLGCRKPRRTLDHAPVAACRTQADFVAGGHKEFMVAYGDQSWHYYTIPAIPTAKWSSTRVCVGAIDEGIAVGDIDGDGDLDVAGVK